MSLIKRVGPLVNSGIYVVLRSLAVDSSGTTQELSALPAVRSAGDAMFAVMRGSSTETVTNWTHIAQSTTDSTFGRWWSRTADGTSSDTFDPDGLPTSNNCVVVGALATNGGTFTYGEIITEGSAGGITAASVNAVGPGIELLFVVTLADSDPTIATPSGFTLLGTDAATSNDEAARGSIFRRGVGGAGAVGSTAVTTGGTGAGSSTAVKVLVSL